MKRRLDQRRRFSLAALHIACFPALMIAANAADRKIEPKIDRFETAIAECRAATQFRPVVRHRLVETSHAICFVGAVVIGDEALIIPKLRDNQKIFVVASGGGSAVAAARVGLHLLDKKIDIAIHDLCFSACANYFFLGGARKYVADDTLLAWHGAPTKAPEARDRLVSDEMGWLALTLHLSDLFFSRARVDSWLAIRPNSLLAAYPSWFERTRSSRNSGWTWTRRALQQRFHVQGIVRYWQPPNGLAAVSLAARHRLDILFDDDSDWDTRSNYWRRPRPQTH